jgi:predicted transcriptional regulator YdeE
MRRSIVDLSEIKLVGLAIKTNNELELKESTANIGTIINTYHRDRIAEKIDYRKKSGTTYSLYTDYESDFRGDYTYIVGEEVASFGSLIQGLVPCVIPAQTYIRFTGGPGPLPALCIDMWQEIWGMTDEELGGKRSYLADFEIYDVRALDPNNAEIDIYIGIVSKKSK